MLPADDFAFLQRLLRERSGLALSADKQYLITTRLKPVMEDHGLKTLSALVARLRAAPDGEITSQVVEAMTTNESLFFRDTKPFEALTALMLPRLCATRGKRPIRIWCAAASTGQEPYSIAIVLEENAARFSNHAVEILATDLSQAAVRRARLGEYTAFEVGRGMPKHYLERYFKKTTRNHYVIAPKVRARVTFEVRNLLEPFNQLGSSDIVFCRNVLIYFDRATKRDVLERLAQVIPPDGYLVLGGPETTLGLTDKFSRHPEWRNVYVRAAPASVGPLATDRICA
jgi:chemotaxis protein methyltransferase CheR